MQYYFVTYHLSSGTIETFRFSSHSSAIDFVQNILEQYQVDKIEIIYE